jgi:hypothetical protein
MSDDPKLIHMDVGARNRRLYEELAKTGLFIVPVFAESDPTRIDYLQVSVSRPDFAEQSSKEATGRGVAMPVAGAQVVKGGHTAQRSGVNVVDFPTIRSRLAVGMPPNDAAVAVHGVAGTASQRDRSGEDQV